jgi:response regulator RpfG family c-di-GMP phosphodiesterase
MAAATVLCIHRDPKQLRLLKEKGYGLVTATSGSDGLRLLKSHPVDAVVLEYYLELSDGAVVANAIKRVRPQLPIVMVADPQGLPRGALKSVDTLVDKSDGPHFLWAAVHFLLTTRVDTDSLPAGSRTTPESRLGEPNKAKDHGTAHSTRGSGKAS